MHALSALSTCLQDKDSALFPGLLAGAPTGFDNDIPPSGCLLPAPPTEHAFALDLAICQGNWQGAESDPASLQVLIRAEEDAGFVREFSLWARQGSCGTCQHSPRTMKETTPGTNQARRVPEKSSLPSLGDIRAAFPLRQDNEEVAAFSADIRSAHKTARIRERDQGLLGCQPPTREAPQRKSEVI